MPDFAKYGFLPWLRQGISAKLNREDVQITGESLQVITEEEANEGSSPFSRATFDANINIKGVIPGQKDFDEASEMTITKTIQMVGPGDIIGFSKKAIVKEEPLADISNFEPNYLAYIEFYDEDFPWRYTPAKAVGEKLTPWIQLIILEEGEYSVQINPKKTFPTVTINASVDPADIFAKPDQLYAWAHIHINEDITFGGGKDPVYELVQSQPNLASSRILCPRKMKPNTDYQAFLVPVYEQGRRAGLGMDEKEIIAVDIQSPIYDPAADSTPTILPFYHDWSFRTGENVDFEFLARLIDPIELNKSTGVGRRDMDIQEPGYGLHFRGNNQEKKGVLELEGALRTTDYDRTEYVAYAVDDTDKVEFLERLAQFLNLNDDLFEETLASNFYDPNNNQIFVEQEELAGAYDDPVVTAPLYGQFHIEATRVDIPDGGGPNWFQELNLDPRNRVPAAFGSNVIKKNQEELMDRAWEQVGDIIEANKKLKRATHSLEISKKLCSKYYDNLVDTAYMRLTSFYHSKVPTSGVAMDTFLQGSTLNKVLFQSTFAKVSRPNGPLYKRTNVAINSEYYNNLTASLNADEISTASFIKPSDRLFQSSFFNHVSMTSLLTQLADQSIDTETNPLAGGALLFQGYFEAVNWEGGYSFLEEKPSAVRPRIEQNLNPEVTIPQKVYAAIAWAGSNRNIAEEDTVIFRASGLGGTSPSKGINEIFAYPKFEEPMYVQLKEKTDNFVPNLNKIPENSLALLETNNPFIEAYMLGLNHEMAQELFWREYPTDRKGSYFRMFWENVDRIAHTKEDEYDITAIHEWEDNSLLGEHESQTLETDNTARLVVVVRGELLKKFPNTLIYLNKATADKKELADDSVDANVKQPIFFAKVGQDITFIGFDIDDVTAKGDDAGNPGWYVVLKERPGEPRFGLDIPSDEVSTFAFWNDMDWADLDLKDGQVIDLSPAKFLNDDPSKLCGPDPSSVNEDHFCEPISQELTWGKNSADMAGIMFQLPYMLAVHAENMIP